VHNRLFYCLVIVPTLSTFFGGPTFCKCAPRRNSISYATSFLWRAFMCFFNFFFLMKIIKHILNICANILFWMSFSPVVAARMWFRANDLPHCALQLYRWPLHELSYVHKIGLCVEIFCCTTANTLASSLTARTFCTSTKLVAFTSTMSSA
jgi:hypothetical protein